MGPSVVGTICSVTFTGLCSWRKKRLFLIDIIDTYLFNSIKGGESERRLRGEGKKYVLKSTGTRLPSDMPNFLRNGQNKEMLFNLLEVAIIEEKQNLHKAVVYFSNNFPRKGFGTC